MKESLKLFGIESAGFEDAHSSAYEKKNDEEVLEEALKINSLQEREDYLRKILNTFPIGYVKSKRCLSELIKGSDPQFACDLILSASKCSPVDPLNYLLFGEIAVANNAWIIAKSALEVAKWLCFEEHSEILNKTESLLAVVEKKIVSGEPDNSKNDFWISKFVAKYWLLERLYFQSNVKKIIEYAFKLLKTFPEDKQNYEVVFNAFALTEDKSALNKYIEYLTENLDHEKVMQNLYLGMCYCELSEYEKSNLLLKAALKDEPRNSKAQLYLALTFLMTNQIKEFIKVYESIIPVIEPKFIAIHFISSALSNHNLGSKEFPNQKPISREVSVILGKLLDAGHNETAIYIKDQFIKLNYHIILPFLNLYMAEMFIKHDELELAKEQIKNCTDSEIHRLNAWIYRLEGKETLAEEELAKYRKYWMPNKDAGMHCKTVGLNLPEEVSTDINKIFAVLTLAYKQTKELIQQFDLEYGLNAMTCVETGCQDCCKKTFPYVSYIEYLYMKDWLEKQSPEVQKNIYDYSKKVVETYKLKYKRDPSFIFDRNVDSRKEYPIDFKFDCPFLGDNKCNVYEARPYICRAYGYGSSDGVSFKGCTYFYEQIKGASKLNDVRKVLEMQSFFNFTTEIDKKLLGKAVVAPIPVWFSCTHEENLEKIKQIKA